MTLHLGLDFDNCLIDYDGVWEQAGRCLGIDLPPAAGKTVCREYLRSRGENGERDWQRLQAMTYGALISQARPMDGAFSFLRFCVAAGHSLFVVSHKGRYAARPVPVFSCAGSRTTRPNLHAAALQWLEQQGLFEQGLFRRDAVFFEPDRLQKIARIRALACSYFVDDLLETFLDHSFPQETKKILYAPVLPASSPGPGIILCRSWQEVLETVAARHEYCAG